MAYLNGISAYQQINQTGNQSTKKKEEVSKNSGTSGSSGEGISKTDKEIKTTTWSPINTYSSLVPSYRKDVGMAIGDVQLSDKAKEYYSKLKDKFGNMEFILVSKDMKSQVQANAAAYGNANKQVVLIDDAKLEQMANDESFRKKYEGIIAMSQSQLANAKNSLASSGAGIKNFGMSVNSEGITSFFATLEKSANEQAKRIEEKQAEKKAAKAKEKKQAEKKQAEKKAEEDKVKEKEIENTTGDEAVISENDNKQYIVIKADSIEDLVSLVSKYAYDNSEKMVMTEAERAVGQNFDFKG